VLQLVELLDNSRAPGKLLDEVETLQGGNFREDDGARQGTATGRHAPAWERRRCGPQQRDGDGAAVGEGMATARLLEGMETARLSSTRWRRCGRAEDGGGDLGSSRVLAGAARCLCCLAGRVIGPQYMRRRRQNAWTQLLRWMPVDGRDGHRLDAKIFGKTLL
jgi:hypothetical protein